MKIKLLFFIFFVTGSIYSQNRSFGGISTTIPATPSLGVQEIFRFRSGAVGQLDGTTTDYNFAANSKWFALGRVNAGTQSFYGLRVQELQRGLVFGYTSSSLNNPRIEWIGSSTPGVASLGNLEFRVGDGFGGPGGPGLNTLVSTMTSSGNTIFGPQTGNPFTTSTNQPRVGVFSNNTVALDVRSINTIATSISASGGNVGVSANGSSVGVSASGSNAGVTGNGDTGVIGSGNTGVFGKGIIGVFGSGEEVGVKAEAGQIGIDVVSKVLGAKIVSNDGRGFEVEAFDNDNLVNTGGAIITTTGKINTGLLLKTDAGTETIGVNSFASSGVDRNIGVKGTTFSQGNFEAGIYGETVNNNGNQWAGFFDGDIFTSSGSFIPSDRKLKTNVVEETNVLELINKLRPVTYEYNKTADINLSSQSQHGFISQELAEVFPELTKDVTKPTFDKDGKTTSSLTLKAINYTGLISVLTAGIQELSSELQILKDEIATLKEQNNAQKLANSASKNGFTLEQNIPNPFTDRTLINYSLSNGVTKGNIMIFDLSGKLIKDFPVNENKGQITVTASQIGKGFFIYSLVQNGQELISKKMIIN
ncbi:tail fiber domain-containing protein [Flavobacterium dankookense]|uniref:Putative secreted protein (Por secretion system target) n=1 Tax=Flavobacterium dankookense TaxID=706186 RepID=A0A4R6QFD5_9FLAO|nr:tail fiber domain-containing protein [Flavobacterium dankookense]TDP60209.1 putative secreted protein (Por secretion system target) [Flavobacterium dankookense]